jgi:RNA methyltransferase, TrmH family
LIVKDSSFTFMEITSTKNPKILSLIKLRAKASYRREQKVSIFEGRKEWEMMLDSKFSPQQIFICPDYWKQSMPEVPKACEKFLVSPAVYDKIAMRGGTEGIVGTFLVPEFNLSDLILKESPLLLILEKVEKPGNLGALLRTADATAVDAVIVLDPGTDLYNPNTIRASLGCIFSLPLIAADPKETLAYLRKQGIKIVAATPHSNRFIYTMNLAGRVAIAVGTEHEGLSESLMQQADDTCKIPMYGKIDSLNVSVSAGVILYEAIRQRAFRES